MVINRFFLLAISIFFLPDIYAQDAIAVSSNPGPGLHIALNWSPSSGASSYSIFRRDDTDPGYPAAPVNTLPVTPTGNCFTITSLLITAPDSLDYKIVAKSLGDSVLFDPCLINTISKTSEKYSRIVMLARRNMPIALVAGLGYKDNTVSAGKGYFYKIIALDGSNHPIGIVATDLHVVAGSFVPVVPPTGVIAEAGDATIQIRWNRVNDAAGYVIERSAHPAGIFQRINESKYSVRITNHLNGDTLVPSAEGISDFQRYSDVTGKAISHKVNFSLINGPFNGVTYYYRIRSLDFFDRPGLPSVLSNAVTPKDTTKPSVPLDLATTVNDSTGRVTIRWTQVVKDINAHWEQPDSSVRYNVYRFTSSENPTTNPSVLVTSVSPLPGQLSKDTTDTDPGLRGVFGNKTWWYRVRSVDTAGNLSQWSSAVSAIVKDTTAPGIVKNLKAKGFEDRISVKWQVNTEPDMAGYMVYRSLCHLGSWVECNSPYIKDTSCQEWSNYNPNPQKQQEPNRLNNERSQQAHVPKLPCPCSGPFVFLGEITQDSAKRAAASGKFFFDDRTIPAASPLCYAYWIKAKDSSDNLSGSFPLPSAAERSEIACQRLHDVTPPEPALISGLFAQADQITVEWIGPPTQDTRAYHVYRAEGTDPAKEPAASAYKWVGGMTIELPPKSPQVLTAPYTPPGIAPCDKISVQATPWMSEGSFEDKKIQPKLTYWYRVTGIDYDGNETPLKNAAPISTFSFTRQAIPAPVLDVLAKQSDPCGVLLQWTPAFDPANQAGFIVYRSSSASGVFTPIVVSPLKVNSFTDNGVVHGQTYWYKVGLLMKNGHLSQLSAAQGIVP
jgi:chitodextrinase